FAVGLLLAAGSPPAVAETEIQEGQARQSLALSVADFVDLVNEDGERRVLSFSLVEFAEKAAAEGARGEALRISLVDLVAKKTAQKTDDTTVPAQTETAVDTGAITADAPEPAVETAARAPSDRTATARVHLVLPPAAAAGEAEAVEPPAATAGQNSVQAEDDGESEAMGSARRNGGETPPTPESPALLSTNAADQTAPAPLPVAPGDGPTLPDGFSAEASDMAQFDAMPGNLHLFAAVRSALNAHPAIVESLSRLDQQQELVSAAQAGYWPQVRSGINTGYRHSTGRSEEAFTVS